MREKIRSQNPGDRSENFGFGIADCGKQRIQESEFRIQE
jgi:hypothetical protein